jgi:hypothetical protein
VFGWARGKPLTLPREQDAAKFFGLVSAILLVLMFSVPQVVLRALILFGLAAALWRFLFHGTTAISLNLEGRLRRFFQLCVSVIFPVLLALFFLKDTPHITIEGLLTNLRTWWLVVPVAIIAMFGYGTADQANTEHPFRAFMIASLVLFIICFMGYIGISAESDGEETHQYISKEQAAHAAETGSYALQYIVYVVAAYLGMLFRFKEKGVSLFGI